jgi:hypothetical protein
VSNPFLLEPNGEHSEDKNGLDTICDGHDDDCWETKPKEFSHTFRNEGMVIYLRLEYLDDWDRTIRYTYKFDRME